MEFSSNIERLIFRVERRVRALHACVYTVISSVIYIDIYIAALLPAEHRCQYMMTLCVNTFGGL